MTTAVFSYRNFCFDPEATITNDFGSFQANAPVTNLLTPILGQLAIASTAGTTNEFFVVFRPGSPSVGVPVRLVALLNHNIITVPSPYAFSMAIEDTSGRIYFNNLADTIMVIGPDGSFQNHAFFLIPVGAASEAPQPVEPLDLDSIERLTINVNSTAVCGTLDPYTGDITPAPFRAGAVWAGPIFQPTHGISLEGFGQSVADNSQVSRSIGGQVWSSPHTRQRIGVVEFAGLLELEVYDLAPAQSLQQLATYCGMSRPLVVIPVSDDSELVYLQGMYGYLITVPKWSSVEKVNTDDTQKRLYTGSLEIMEAR